MIFDGLYELSIVLLIPFCALYASKTNEVSAK